ncbi:MAG: chromate transporter [Fastidiosipilaceae bacterium]
MKPNNKAQDDQDRINTEMSGQEKELQKKGACANAKPTQKKSLWVFFWSCFKISAVTFGGGYVIVPLQKRRFCDELHWIAEDKVLDLVAMGQCAPGPLAVNASTLMGQYIFGYKGAVTAVAATALPPLIILSIISLFYKLFAANPAVRAVLRGMQAAVAALIVYTVLTMAWNLLKKKSAFSISLLVIFLGLAIFTRINVIFIILAAALIAIVTYFFVKNDIKQDQEFFTSNTCGDQVGDVTETDEAGASDGLPQRDDSDGQLVQDSSAEQPDALGEDIKNNKNNNTQRGGDQ